MSVDGEGFVGRGRLERRSGDGKDGAMDARSGCSRDEAARFRERVRNEPGHIRWYGASLGLLAQLIRDRTDRSERRF